jgi:hypothetical protein
MIIGADLTGKQGDLLSRPIGHAAPAAVLTSFREIQHQSYGSSA